MTGRNVFGVGEGGVALASNPAFREDGVPVTMDNVVRAETAKYFSEEMLKTNGVALPNEQLAYDGLDGYHALAKARRVNRYVRPSEHMLALADYESRDEVLTDLPTSDIAGEEELANSLLARKGKVDSALCHFGPEEAVGYRGSFPCHHPTDDQPRPPRGV